MSRLQQLAMDWSRTASESYQDAQRHPVVNAELMMAARTRKNCAWELRRILQEMEKENPLEGGCLRADQSDVASV